MTGGKAWKHIRDKLVFASALKQAIHGKTVQNDVDNGQQQVNNEN